MIISEKAPAQLDKIPDFINSLLDKIDSNLRLALRNIANLELDLAKDTHAYEILSHQKVIINKEGLSILTDRLKQ